MKDERTTYVSPLTGLTYEAVPTDRDGWFRYEILQDDRKVQFALTEEGIAGSVAHAEGVGDGWTSSARD
jgi:hypothetical protein